jgi:hypothetical protein
MAIATGYTTADDLLKMTPNGFSYELIKGTFSMAGTWCRVGSCR